MSELHPTLKGSLPKGDGNGLNAIGYDLAENPKLMRVAVMLFDCEEITEKVDSGDRKIKVRVRRIEVIRNTDDAMAMRRLLMRAFEERSGKVVLPLELENDVNAAFEEMGEGPILQGRDGEDVSEGVG